MRPKRRGMTPMIVIGSRGSRLALAQAEWTAAKLRAHGLECELNIIKTKGDVVMERFDKIEGKGFFTKEIEDALTAGAIDLAVHSLKDLPTASPPGLAIRAIPERESPYDALIAKTPLPKDASGAPDLAGMTVGTSSNRRVQALAALCPEARFKPIRGNVPTRLAKMADGEVDAVVLARAGLNRLGLNLDGFHTIEARPPMMTPAPGQGALALQTRDGFDEDISFLHHEPTARCVHAERRILAALEGGCQLPLGALIQSDGDGFRLDLFRGFADGREPTRLELQGPAPESLADQAIAALTAARP